MRRREFITLLGSGAAAAWPLSTRAQQSAKPPIIGYLSPTRLPLESQWTAAFVRRLHELGWIEGSTVEIEYRWAEGHAERLSAFADELVRLKVSVIVTNATPPTIAAKRATSVIPIVFAVSGDPVGSGLVASLARPGGNVTGLSIQSVDAVSKRVELLRDVVPNLRRLAVLANESNPMIRREAEEVQAAAHALGVEVAPLDVRRADDIAPAFATLDGRADALYVTTDPLFFNNILQSAPWRSKRDCRTCTVSGRKSSREVCCHTEQAFLICFGAPPSWSIRFCAGRSPPTSRSSSRPNSISSSISRPPRRSGLPFRITYSCLPTR